VCKVSATAALMRHEQRSISLKFGPTWWLDWVGRPPPPRIQPSTSRGYNASART